MHTRKLLVELILVVLFFSYQNLLGEVSTQSMRFINNLPKVTVEASLGGEGYLNKIGMCRLVAMCNGDLYRYSVLTLHINKVVEGNLYDPNFAGRPIGVNNLYVVVINDAAIALDKFGTRRVKGIWKLSTLPNGAYIVSSLADTPFNSEDITTEKNVIVTIGDDLKSGDAERQNWALQKLKEIKSFTHIELIFPLLDSDQKVIVPNAICVSYKDGSHAMFPKESTLGAEARKVLLQLTASLRREDSPAEKDDGIVWQRWWKGILDIEPFPEVYVEQVSSKVLAILPMNQTWPEIHISPDGTRGLIGVSRYQYLVNNARSGIRLLDFKRSSDDDFVYKVPLKEVNAEPTGLAVAWAKNAVAVAWKEYFYDENLFRVKFMALSFSGPTTDPIDLNLKRVSNMSLCYLGDEQWLLFFTAKPEDYDPKNHSDRKRRELFVMKLDSSGRVLLKTPPLEMPFQPNNDYSHMVRTVTAVSTPKGTAVVFTNEDIGPFLLLLDKELKVRRLTQINDMKLRQSTSESRLSWNGKVFCTSWISQNKLFVRQFNEDGKPITKPQQIAASIVGMSGPVPCQDGFALVWTCRDFLINQVRLGIVSDNGSEKKQYIVYNGMPKVSPVELAVVDTKARVMMYDRQIYPRRLLLKDITLK